MRETEAVMYQDIPQPKLQTKQLTNWSVKDIVMASITVAVVGASLIFLGVWGCLLFTVILVPLNIRTRHGYGRMYSEIVTGVKSFLRDTLHKGVWWEANDTSGSHFARYLRQHHTAIPLRAGRVQATIDGKLERFSLLHQLDRPYDHFLITARGGAFVNEDINQQARLVSELADRTNQVIAQSDLKAGISYLRITSPFDPAEPTAMMRESLNPIVAQPELFDLDTDTLEWAKLMHQVADEIRSTAAANGAAEMWSLIVITIKRSVATWRSAGKGALNDEEVYDLPIVEFGRSLVDSLASSTTLGLQDVHCLSLPELASVVRASWDATGIQKYMLARDRGEIPRTDEEVDAVLAYFEAEAQAEAAQARKAKDKARILAEGKTKGAAEVDRLLQMWPQKCVKTSLKGDYLQFDDNYIGILRITQLPDKVRSDTVMALHYVAPTGRWTRLAMVGQSVSGDTETQQSIVGESALINFQRAWFKNRVVQNPKFAKKQRELALQTQQISANSVAQYFNGFYTVVESSPRRLHLALKEAKASLNNSHFKCEQVEGSARLIDIGVSALLGTNRA